MSGPTHQDTYGNPGKDAKRHEDNLRFLRLEANRLDETILELQVSLGKYYSASTSNAAIEKSGFQPEDETTKQILQQEKSAAGAFCLVTMHHPILASKLSLTKDVLGVVATLATVDNDNVSRLLSEYLGMETMLGIVCSTVEGVKGLEKYDREGQINSSTGLHGLGSSIGRNIDGRFLVICLEDLRPYVGEFLSDDPQKKLALQKPKLPNGICPSGFLDFAVNMVNLDRSNLSYVTAGGHGLRETLFYSLFSLLQVYRTRTEMLLALPYITHGALSLDGGMVRKGGVFALGDRKNVEVKFPVISGTSKLPASYIEIEDRIKKLKWERLTVAEDARREQLLLDKSKRKDRCDETNMRL